jgi:tetratricopeptide (TPR) repeat protein
LPLPRAIAELLDRRSERLPSLRVSNPSIPPALDAIAAHCLSYAPCKRYASAAELVEDLERFLDHRPLAHAPNTSRLERVRNWTRRNRLAIGLAAGLLAAAGLGRMVVGHDTNPAPTYVADGIAKLGYQRWDDAERMFKRALELDDQLFTVYQGLAAVESHRRNHEREQSLLTRSIQLAEKAQPPIPGWRIAELYQARAAASLRRGNQLQLPVTKDAFIAAKPHYASALADLDRARQLGGNERPNTRFNIVYDSAWAELGLGDVCSYFDNYEDSVSHFTRAEGFLQQALQLEPQNAYPLSLMREVEGRLKVDGPILDRLQRKARLAGSPASAPAPAADAIPAGD